MHSFDQFYTTVVIWKGSYDFNDGICNSGSGGIENYGNSIQVGFKCSKKSKIK